MDLINTAKLLAQLEELGFGSQAELLANNIGIQHIAAEPSSSDLTLELKTRLEAELTRSETKYKTGFFRRAALDTISDWERQELSHQRVTFQKKLAGGIAEMDFMKNEVPRISYK